MAGSSDANALLLTISADVSKLQKQFDKATGIVNAGSAKMESRAKSAAQTIEGSFTKVNVGKALDSAFDSSRLKIFDSAAARIGVTGRALELLGPAGIGAAGGIVALALAMGQAHEAMAWADDLDKTARGLGETTDNLQKFDYAAVASSVGLEQGREALQNFNGEIGKFEAHTGDVRLAKWATAIHLTRDEAIQARGPVEKLQLVMEKISATGDASERTSAAKAFGLDGLTSVINGGSESIDHFIGKMREAQAAGGVINHDDIKKAAELNDKVEALTYLIGQDFKAAFIEVAPAVEGLAEFIARCAQNLSHFIGEIPDALRGLAMLNRSLGGVDKAPTGINKALTIGSLANPGEQLMLGGRMLMGALAREGKAGRMADAMKGLGHVDFSGTDLDPALGKLGTQLTPNKAAKTKRGPTDRSDQLLDQLAQQQAQATAALIGNVLEWVKTYDPSNVNRIDVLIDDQAAAELKGVDAALAKQKADLLTAAKKGEISKSAAIEAADAAENVAYDKRILIARKTQEEHAKALAEAERRRLEQADQLQQIYDGIASNASAMATSSAERRKIELAILESDQKLLQQHLDAERAADPLAGTTHKSSFDARQAALDDKFASERDKAIFDTRGPIKTYLDEISNLNDQFQTFAVEGVKGLSDALAQALFDSKDFGASIVNIFKNLFAQILSAEIQKNLFSPILGALNLIPAHAAGTDFAPGGLTMVGERGAELVNMPRGSQVFTASKSRDILRSLQHGGGGGGALALSVEPSPYFDVRVRQIAEPFAQGYAHGGGAAARQAARADQQRRERFSFR